MNTERTPLFLMANLGAEVSRLLSSRERNDTDAVRASFARAEHILAQLRAAPDMQSRTQELDSLSTVITDFTKSKPTLAVSSDNLRSYFRPFALKVMAS